MNDHKHVAWLNEQLPTLVSEGVLPPESAARLQQRYGSQEIQSGRHWTITLFSILGAALLGGGIILLLGHNWEELSRPVRVVLALAPLLISQGVAGWVLWSRNESTAWREGVGTFLTLAIGIAIALVSQTYHLGGDLGEFLLAWALLALPLVYLLRATWPALLYIIGITVWTSTVMNKGWQALGYWPLLLAIVPYLWLLARTNRYHVRPVLLAWILGLTLPFGLSMSLHRIIDAFSMWILEYSALAGALYLAGTLIWDEATTIWQRPWQVLGALGTVSLALALSFEGTWQDMLHFSSWQIFMDAVWPSQVAYGLTLVWPLAALLLWADSLRQRDLTHIFLGAMPVVAIVGYALVHAYQTRLPGMLLCNAYVLALGIVVLVTGVRARRLGAINGGMSILAALLVSRFFDAELGFAARGVVFILLGLVFLGTNLVLIRRKGA